MSVNEQAASPKEMPIIQSCCTLLLLQHKLLSSYPLYLHSVIETMTLANWSYELIHQVLEEEAIDLQSRCSVARVNRRMRELVLPILYRSIEFNISKLEASNVGESRLLVLQRTLSENTYLAAFVHYLKISWESGSDAAPRDVVLIDPELGKGINDILSRVLNLQSLVLEMTGRQAALRPTYQCSFLAASNPFAELRELRIRGLSIKIDTVAVVFGLPKLEVFEVQILALSHQIIAGKHDTSIRSTVKDLSIGPYCQPNWDLERIFWWPSGLEKLTYDLGAECPPPPFDVPTLSQLLAPQSDTLVCLHLTGSNWVTTRLSNLDFRLFSKLKHLKIASTILFPCKSESLVDRTPYRNSLYKRLPKSLERLEV